MHLPPLIALVLLGGVACSGRAAGPGNEPAPEPPAPTAPPSSSAETAPMTDAPFTDGPAVTPPDALLAWLESEGADKTLRLPVVVSVSPLGVTGGVVATSPPDAPEAALALKLDDGAMATSLQQHLARVCPGETTCAVWLEGTWGPNVAMPALPGPGGPGGPTAGPKRHPFAVRAVVGPIAEGDAAVVKVRR